MNSTRRRCLPGVFGRSGLLGAYEGEGARVDCVWRTRLVGEDTVLVAFEGWVLSGRLGGDEGEGGDDGGRHAV